MAELTQDIMYLMQALYRQFVAEPRSEVLLRAYAQAREKPGWVFHRLQEQRHEQTSASP